MKARSRQGASPAAWPRRRRVGFVSLGCPKALVDSERILTRLRAEGYEIVGSYAEADLVVVNTCGFIEAAVEESLAAIGEALAENGRVVVTGCLGARADQVRAAHPQVLAVTGPHDDEAVLAAVHEFLPRPHDPTADLVPSTGIKLTPRHYAYLKIAEGCNHRCTFCIIPALRGDLVSRPVGEILAEAERLVVSGVQEIIVIAQDTSAYGVDLRYRTGFWHGRPVKARLTELARALGSLGVWVRLHYVYPYPHVDELIPLMAEGRILPYLDMPLQHASARLLKLMKRPAASGGEEMLARLRRWREICPELTLRSTFIVGFPGETEEDFARLLDFLEAAELDRVGAFAYSPVEGAAANRLPGAVPEEIKQARLARLMERQAAISARRLARWVGREREVIIDGPDPEHAGVFLGRSASDAPEVDGCVRVHARRALGAGERVRVRITASDAYDLQGALLA